ncbi:hypothetical protein, partial [Bacteroides heparinolyticus]|uniref:hypothetical protein n=2 Tax=Prevotella heparinolytica TaxID=28113 RepID=UPI00359FA901
LLPNRRKPVHSGNIRPIECSPSSLAKGITYPEFWYNVSLIELIRMNKKSCVIEMQTISRCILAV